MLAIFSIVIAGISIVISLFTLYLGHLRKPKLSAHVGPYIVVIYDNLGLTFTVPTTIANASPQVGVVRRCSMTVTRRGNSQENHRMLWHSFRKISSDGGTWIQVGTAHSIPVIGRSTATKDIQYIWRFDSKPDLVIREGTYDLRFDFWAEDTKPFETVKHELRLREVDVRAILQSKAPGSEGGRIRMGVVYLTLDSETNENRVLTEHEIKSLMDRGT